MTYREAESRPSARMIAAITIIGGGMYRTHGFRKPSYVGDPINAVRLFSDKGADELVVLDISGEPFVPERSALLRSIASEALMPIAYGGGIRDLETIRSVIRNGYEKVVLNTVLHENPAIATAAASEYGSQAVVASIEVGKGLLGGRHVLTKCGRTKTKWTPIDWARRCQEIGCGEILLTGVDRDGSMSGYDLETIAEVCRSVSIPVIAMGGAGTVEHHREAVKAGASASAAGSMFVYFGPRRAVLVNYPTREPAADATA